MAALVIGIAGGSGSGKTTIARKIADAVPASAVTILEHDAYYRDRPELSYDRLDRMCPYGQNAAQAGAAVQT